MNLQHKQQCNYSFSSRIVNFDVDYEGLGPIKKIRLSSPPTSEFPPASDFLFLSFFSFFLLDSIQIKKKIYGCVSVVVVKNTIYPLFELIAN